jgi:hypothetical protein
MNRLLFFVALVAAAMALAVAPATVAMAQVTPAVPAIEEISGTYVNEEAGLEITLPDGWAGFAVPAVNGATSVMASPDALTEEAQADIMILSIVEKTSMDENTVPESSQRPGVPEDAEAQCEEPQIEQVQVNGMEGVMMETECTTEGDTYRSKMYSFQTEERFYMVAYAANSEGDYDGNVGAFDSSVNTLTIENTIEAPAIPEFPLAAIGAIAAVIGTIAVLGRTRFMRGGM